ncbi:hypothetical protein [Streptomyces fulvorobeus]|uniref:Chromosome segregation ATPase n=1 Tax=Streptomyces fulvorobeus TaxID=284028 RepID=A0A7J0C6F2_9ACTN|nr:hypothetical protein [Streptomyces fulvorobeus]NYE41671.1 chromosome segregation ATPase [Streptomyces fulvorobeus]GFM98040.1 hypothetical protein Sfulv_28510 [Streptomyces fulvorobeus]
MITLIRIRTLAALRDSLTEAETEAEAARTEADKCLEQSGDMLDHLTQADDVAEELRADLAQSRLDAARLEGELEALRAQVLLDTEDRQALRTLLRAVRKQNQRAHRVYVLFRFGELHSIHATADAAEIAAEAEGAARAGWTPHTTCCDGTTVPASEVRWRIQPVLLGETR